MEYRAKTRWARTTGYEGVQALGKRPAVDTGSDEQE